MDNLKGKGILSINKVAHIKEDGDEEKSMDLVFRPWKMVKPILVNFVKIEDAIMEFINLGMVICMTVNGEMITGKGWVYMSHNNHNIMGFSWIIKSMAMDERFIKKAKEVSILESFMMDSEAGEVY